MCKCVQLPHNIPTQASTHRDTDESRSLRASFLECTPQVECEDEKQVKEHGNNQRSVKVGDGVGWWAAEEEEGDRKEPKQPTVVIVKRPARKPSGKKRIKKKKKKKTGDKAAKGGAAAAAKPSSARCRVCLHPKRANIHTDKRVVVSKKKRRCCSGSSKKLQRAPKPRWGT